MTLPPLPSIPGPVTISFKDEYDDRGPVGPVIVTDVDAFNADCRAKDITPGPTPAETIRPFGTTIAGEHNLGWLPLRDAKRIAKHYGVTLDEF